MKNNDTESSIKNNITKTAGADAVNISIIKSRRKSISIRINDDLSVTVRAPLYMKKSDIMRFVNEKSGWIEKHMKMMRERMEKSGSSESPNHTRLSYGEIKKLADKALDYIPPRVSYFASVIGVTYGRITIRNQRTRWGSCSGKGNLNFNCLLMLMPEDIIDYVIVHELCHRIEMNHSKAFWDNVGKVIPDYQNKVKWLKENGSAIMRRMSS